MLNKLLGLRKAMYKEAEKQINEGLSPFARIFLGLVAGLFGFMMISIAPPTDNQLPYYMIGGFCLLISLCCITTGRVRQFAGSIIGCVLFISSLFYIYSQLGSDSPLFSARSDQSLFNSFLFLVCFGLPGITYVVKAKFGLSSAKPEKS